MAILYHNMKKEACFSAEQLEAIAKVLGETDTGLTGSEIEHVLVKCKIEDVDPTATKWKRLYNAFANCQNHEQCGNNIIAFVNKAMSPVRFTNQKEQFAGLRQSLNVTLAFSGLKVDEDGKVKRTAIASTISEAVQRAVGLKKSLVDRNVHPDVLRFCQAELLQENYFHAVLEATKSVANKLRQKTDLTSDGAKLATDALSLGQSGYPLLAINNFGTDTEKAEQRGFMNLVIGLFGTFRNPTAHAEKIYWPIGEQDALDILSLVSLVHRKLDVSIRK